ncbi:hypothetical protein AN697_11780 [Enterobacter cloacae subsp. cloacae]|nr:hypothetical protein AN697_11780 [Enterobacter cloacae subsp. cloacae]
MNISLIDQRDKQQRAVWDRIKAYNNANDNYYQSSLDVKVQNSFLADFRMIKTQILMRDNF